MVEHKFGLLFKKTDLNATGIFREIRAEVVFGTPSKHCAGAGICMVSISGFHSRVITCPKAPAWVSSDHSGRLLFRFEKSCLQTEIMNAYFKNTEFPVEEKFRLPLRLVRQMGLFSSWVLPGAYQILEQDDDWMIRFTLD